VGFGDDDHTAHTEGIELVKSHIDDGGTAGASSSDEDIADEIDSLEQFWLTSMEFNQ
jgi:hypothetical protein